MMAMARVMSAASVAFHTRVVAHPAKFLVMIAHSVESLTLCQAAFSFIRVQYGENVVMSFICIVY